MKEYPSSLDAEKAILSCLIQDPEGVAPVLSEKGITANKFHFPHCAIILEAAMAMWGEGRMLDLITLTDEIKKQGHLEQIGGAGELSHVAFFSPVTSMLPAYLETVQTDWKRRELIRITQRCSENCFQRDETPERLASRVIEDVASLSVDSEKRVQTQKELAYGVIQRCQDAIDNKGKPKNLITTGFSELDALLTGGIRPKNFILITAVTKGGKTIFVDNIVEHACVIEKAPTIVFSLEMSVDERADRMVASMGRISATSMQMGWLNEGDLRRLEQASTKFAYAPLVIRDDLFTLSQIVGAIRQEKLRNPGLKMAVVDYLQLIDEPQSKNENREQVIARISTTLRRLAAQLDIAILFLSQENDDGRARESRRLEQDCTTWIQIESDKEDENVKNAKVRLNRNGPPGMFKLTHLKFCLRFENYTPERK